VDKQQKLRNTAEGLLAGLIAIGFQGPWRWSHHRWEEAFCQAWGAWEPAKDPQVFRTFSMGGSANGRTSQAREIFSAVKRTSPFAEYNREPLNRAPRGLTPEDYLATCVEGATPQEWMDLARAFLQEMGEPIPDRHVTLS